MLSAGIVGLPNVGKSTLFNAVTRSRKAQAANYPFCTIDPNLGVVTVPGALWVFVRQYTTRRGVSRRAMALLLVEPVVVLALLALPATRDLVHYYRPQDRAAGDLGDPPVAVAGPLFWPHAAYSYVLLVAALVVLPLVLRHGWVTPTRREWTLLSLGGVGWFGVYNLSASAPHSRPRRRP